MAAVVRDNGRNFEGVSFNDGGLDITGWIVEIKGGLKTITLSMGAFAAAVFTLTN